MLLVEDDLMNQKLAQMVLRKMGIECDTANDGREALELLSSTRYDIVFMDVNMPNLDGIEVTRRLRSGVMINSDTPVIAITSSHKNELLNCLDAGMEGFISKPIIRPEIEAMIYKYVPRKASCS